MPSACVRPIDGGMLIDEAPPREITAGQEAATTQETAPLGGAGSAQDDDLPEIIARVQAAAENGEPQSRVRMQLVQEGVDAETADVIIERVYKPTVPLSRRHRSSASGSESGGGMSWLIWIGLLGLINLLSWLLDWPFWIY